LDVKDIKQSPDPSKILVYVQEKDAPYVLEMERIGEGWTTFKPTRIQNSEGKVAEISGGPIDMSKKEAAGQITSAFTLAKEAVKPPVKPTIPPADESEPVLPPPRTVPMREKPGLASGAPAPAGG
jgi:hypothetical protein